MGLGGSGRIWAGLDGSGHVCMVWAGLVKSKRVWADLGGSWQVLVVLVSASVGRSWQILVGVGGSGWVCVGMGVFGHV